MIFKYYQNINNINKNTPYIKKILLINKINLNKPTLLIRKKHLKPNIFTKNSENIKNQSYV